VTAADALAGSPFAPVPVAVMVWAPREISVGMVTARENSPEPSTVALPSGLTTLEAIVITPEVPGWNPLTLAVMV